MPVILDLTGNRIVADSISLATGAAAIPNIAVTYTSGSAPAAGGSLTIANSATPTVVELLDYIVELDTKFKALTAACKTAGIIE